MKLTVPDFDDLFALANTIKTLMYRKMMLDVEIKAEESNITNIMTTDEKYFQNGKIPSMSYIENTFQYTGFDGKLLAKRKELAEVVSELEESKLKFDISRMELDLYRTEAANQRNTTL